MGTSSDALRRRCHFEDNLAPLESAGMVQLVDGLCELIPGILLLPFPGHTPGHQVVRVDGGAARAYYVGDALHTIAQVQQPSWCPMFDWAPPASIASRRALLERIMEEDAMLLSPHFPSRV